MLSRCSIRLVVNTARQHTYTHTLPLSSPLIKSTEYSLCSELRPALCRRLVFFHKHVSQKGFLLCYTTLLLRKYLFSTIFHDTTSVRLQEFHTTRPHANRLNNVLYRCAEYLGRECSERGEIGLRSRAAEGFHVRSWFSQACET